MTLSSGSSWREVLTALVKKISSRLKLSRLGMSQSMRKKYKIKRVISIWSSTNFKILVDSNIPLLINLLLFKLISLLWGIFSLSLVSYGLKRFELLIYLFDLVNWWSPSALFLKLFIFFLFLLHFIEMVHSPQGKVFNSHISQRL